MMRHIRLLPLMLIGSALLIFSSATYALGQTETKNQLHTPAKGSDERKAIVDAVRGVYKGGDDHPAKFLVNYLKVHEGWAWINVTPLNTGGTPVGDSAPLLFHLKNGKWMETDLVEVTPPDDNVGPADPSPEYIRALRTKYPGCPADIIPVTSK